jgi:hypothetical protein
MTTEPSAHLSEEAMNDVLVGMGSPESQAHVAACGECRAQLRAFQAEMHLFNETSLAWSEARSATLGAISPPKKHASMLIPASWAFAAALLLVVGIPVWMHNHGPAKHPEQTVAAPAAVQQDSAEQIAEDNELMRSVDMALSSGEESPLSEYQITERSHEGPKARLELRHE